MRYEDMDLVLYGVDSILTFVEKCLKDRLGCAEIPEAVIKYIDLEEHRSDLNLKIERDRGKYSREKVSHMFWVQNLTFGGRGNKKCCSSKKKSSLPIS